MSGGSMNYMYLCAGGEPEKLVEGAQEGHVDECMQIALQSKAPDAFIDMLSDDMIKLEESICFLEYFGKKYEVFMQACEWNKSGDWSLGQVKEACEETLKAKEE